MVAPMPFGLKIAILSRAFRKKMDEKVSTFGLTSVQLRVLGALSLLEESGVEEVHQNDLERMEQVTHPAMTNMLQKLEKKGFIQCVTSWKDRRYKKITCTEKSKGMYKMILQQDEDVLCDLCHDFTEEQKEVLFQLIDKILNNVTDKN